MKVIYSIIAFVSVFVLIIACNSSNQSASSGEQLFMSNCASCHMTNGKGIGTLVPDLTVSSKVKENRNDLACMIRYGIDNKDYPMLPNEDLSAIEITNILNFVRKQWHPSEQAFSINEIEENISNCNR